MSKNAGQAPKNLKGKLFMYGIGAFISLLYLKYAILLSLFYLLYQKIKQNIQRQVQLLQKSSIYKDSMKKLIESEELRLLPLNGKLKLWVKNRLAIENIEINPFFFSFVLRKTYVEHILSKLIRLRIGDSPWPQPFQAGEMDLRGINTLLFRRGIWIRKSFLEKKINRISEQIVQQRFEESLLMHQPHLRETCDLNIFIKSYVKLFGEAYHIHLDRIKRFIERRLGRKISIGKIENAILYEIETITNEKLAETFKMAISEGSPLHKTVTIKMLDTMSGTEFEVFLGKLFEAMGFKVRVTPPSRDQGADLILEKFGKRIVVQAKRYSNTVTNKAVQEVVGAIRKYECQEGMVVTTNYYTPSAKDLANVNGIQLVDRDGLETWLEQYGAVIAV